MCPADDTDPSARGDLERGSSFLEGLPRLQALAVGPDGADILAELKRLVARQPQRAPRYRRDLLARIRIDGGRPPEVAVVRDISASGVRLRVPASAHLDVVQARQVTLEMRLPGSPFVTCTAALVRVVERHENAVELAFSLQREGPDPAFEALLAQLAVAEHDSAEAGR